MTSLNNTNTASDTECKSGVSCDAGRCVATENVCNFFMDCEDGVDEEYCQVKVNENGQVVLEFIPGK